MHDFHIHFQLGMSAAEALQAAASRGLRGVGLVLRTDGLDLWRLRELAPRLRELSLHSGVDAWLGVELTQTPPALLAGMVRESRDNGADLVLVHGESLLDPTPVGTNLAGVEAGADILSCPGMVDAEAARRAAELDVALELSALPEHAVCNAHVARMAETCHCRLVAGSGARRVTEIPGRSLWRLLGQAALLSQPEKLERDGDALAMRLYAREKAPAPTPSFPTR